MDETLYLPNRQANRRVRARRTWLAGIAGVLAVLLVTAYFAQIGFTAAYAGYHAVGLASASVLLDRQLPQPPTPSDLTRAISALALLFFLGGALISPIFRRPRRRI
jgi:hypothetical protein